MHSITKNMVIFSIIMNVVPLYSMHLIPPPLDVDHSRKNSREKFNKLPSLEDLRHLVCTLESQVSAWQRFINQGQSEKAQNLKMRVNLAWEEQGFVSSHSIRKAVGKSQKWNPFFKRLSFTDMQECVELLQKAEGLLYRISLDRTAENAGYCAYYINDVFLGRASWWDRWKWTPLGVKVALIGGTGLVVYLIAQELSKEPKRKNTLVDQNI